MDWEKVAAALRALSDQHARAAESYSMRSGYEEKAAQHLTLSQLFYGLLVAFEAGLIK